MLISTLHYLSLKLEVEYPFTGNFVFLSMVLFYFILQKEKKNTKKMDVAGHFDPIILTGSTGGCMETTNIYTFYCPDLKVAYEEVVIFRENQAPGCLDWLFTLGRFLLGLPHKLVFFGISL